MATTIKLKNGTGSAVPSALSQGEVAINIDNGLLYYGSGSGNSVKQLESFTNITSSGDISASGDITAHSASFTGPVKISLATGGTALEITEEDKDQKGRLLFEYDNGDPTLTVASRASTAKLHLRQESGTNGLYLDENGQIYINNSTADGVKIEGDNFHSVGTGGNALGLGKGSRPWQNLYLSNNGSNIFFQLSGTDPDLTLKYPANSNGLILSASGGHPSASFEVVGDISASGDLVSNTLDTKINKLSKTSATDADHQGNVVFFGGTTSMDAGKIYFYNSSGNWALTDADAESTAKGLLAVALGAASDTDGMLIKGMVTLDHDTGTTGDPLFLSVTEGQASSTAPSGTNDIVRLIGYCLDDSDGQIYFNPSNDYIVLS